MGGGGGTSGARGIGDIRSLVEKAKEELRASESAGRRNVFISFAYEDLGAVNLLRGQARNENLPLEFNDWSVSEPISSERAAYIKEKISDRISQCSITVVYLSDTTRSSEWVAWEIAESISQGKHVVAVHPQGQKPSRLPEAVIKHGIRCVSWTDLAKTIANLE